MSSVRTAKDTSWLLSADRCLLAYCSIYNAHTHHAIHTISFVLQFLTMQSVDSVALATQ